MDNKIAKNVLAGILAVVTLAFPAFCQSTIATFAGNGIASYSGDGGQAVAAALNHPRGIAVSADGRVYVADTDNRRIRVIRPDGLIFTFAGNGILGSAGDGGQAINASFSDVLALAVDASGNVYIADGNNRRVRKVTTNGVVTTVAGTGIEGFSGDGGLAVNANLGRPVSILVDPSGNNLYISDATNQRIRRVAADGKISTIAGNGAAGFSGDGGQATAAMLQFPLGLAMDQAGNLYVADGDNNRIRRIALNGTITTFAGKGNGSFSGDGAAAGSASINIPSDVAFDVAGNLYIADSGNNRVRKVDASGTISTVAGTGIDGFSGDGGMGPQAQLNFPWGLATDGTGMVYIADRVNNRIRSLAGPAVGPQNPPSVSSNGIVNGASFLETGVSPGGIAAIFGVDLAVSQVAAATLPLPTTLGVTSVTFNGIDAPLLFVSQFQINVQVPFEVTSGTAQVQVKRGNMLSIGRAVNVLPATPGIFIVDQTTNAGAFLHASSYSLVNASSPARAGEYVLIYCTGLGQVNVAVGTGKPAPATPPLAEAVLTPTVTIGGLQATVSFAGLAPGFAGLYQLNVLVPSGLAPGNQGIRIVGSGASSNTAMIAVN